MNKIKFLLLVLSCIGITLHGQNQPLPIVHQPVFVFDLGGVLFDTKKLTVFRQLGIKDSLVYLVQHRDPQLLKNRFYKVLNRMEKRYGNSYNLNDPDGSPMPQLMADFLRGMYSSKDIIEKICTTIDNHPQWFFDATEQRLMIALTRAIFDPEQFTESRKFLPHLLPLIETLKGQGAKLYILSNWPKESFNIMKEKHKEFFALFDACIISGEVGYVKPELAIFNIITNKEPGASLCFIDDQKENINAGKDAGFYTIRANIITKKPLANTEKVIKESLEFLEKCNNQQNIQTVPSC